MYGNPINLGQPLAAQPVLLGLVGWWLPLQGQSGGVTLYDISGNGYDGALTNGPTWIGAPSGFPGLSFTAASSQGTIITTPGQVDNTNWSISVSFRLSSTSQKGIVTKIGTSTPSANGTAFGVGAGDADTNGNNILILRENKAWHTVASSVGTGWFHLLFTYQFVDGISSNIAAAYLNGVSVFTSGADFDLGDTVYYGGYSTNSRWWNDYAGDLIYWNRPLTASEATTVYLEWRQSYPTMVNRFLPRRSFASSAVSPPPPPSDGAAFAGSVSQTITPIRRTQLIAF